MRKLILCLVMLAVSAGLAYAGPGNPYLSYGKRYSGGGGANTYVLLMGNENANNGTTFVDHCNTGTGCPHTLTANATAAWAAPTGTWPGCCAAPSFVVSDAGNAGISGGASSAWDVSAGASWTWSIWIKFNATASNNGIMGIGTFNSTYMAMFYIGTDNVVRAYLSSNGTSYDIASNRNIGSIADTNWHNIEVDFDGSNYYFFIDGGTPNTLLSSSHVFFNATNSILRCGDAFGQVSLAGQWADCAFHTGSALHTTAFTPSAVPVAH